MPTTAQQPQQALAIIDVEAVPLARNHFGENKLATIKEQIGRGWKQPMTDAELETIAVICARTRLDPLAKPSQIYFIKRWDQNLNKEVMVGQTSIDGARLSAFRTGNYLGPAGTQWCGTDGEWRDIWLDDEPPAAARHGIYVKGGGGRAMWATCLYREYVQKTRDGKPTSFWRDMPASQLAKCAEFKVLKQACPGETNELELAERAELHRLEVPAQAARYAEIFGGDEEQAFAELPMGAGAPQYVPIRERTDLVDQPRANGRVLGAGGDVVNAASGEVIRERQTAAPAQRDRGSVLEHYSVVLTQQRQAGRIPESEMPKWAIPSGFTTEQIIEKGRALRALDNEPMVTSVQHELYQALAERAEQVALCGQDRTHLNLALPAPESAFRELIAEAERIIEQYGERQEQQPAESAGEPF